MVIYQLFVLLAVWGRCQILLENEISIFKKAGQQKEAWRALKFSVNGCRVTVGFQKTQWTNTSRRHCTQIITDWGNLTLDFKQLGLWAFPLPPVSRTLVSKWNTKRALIWKEDLDHWVTVPVLLLLSPGKTPLTTTVAKFLDTSVCGGSWCLDPSLSPFLVKFTQILEYILLDNPHKAMVLSVGCASFSYIYIYAFIRRFYPKRFTVHSGYTFFVSTCVPWESNPQPLRC